MQRSIVKFVMLVLAVFITGSSIAQTVIAGQQITYKVQTTETYVDSNHPTIAMSFASPSAGQDVTAVTNSDLYVRLSLAIWNYGHYHNIGYLAASITSGSVPAGTVLQLVSAPCTTTNSGGSLGTPTGPITLSTVQQKLVTGMGNCYTGTGNMDGYQMTFTLVPSGGNFGQLVAGTYNVSVTFDLNVNQ